MPVRKTDEFSRYSMPNTESNFPPATNSSRPSISVTRPNACSTNSGVTLPAPSPPHRGSSCSRTNAITGTCCA